MKRKYPYYRYTRYSELDEDLFSWYIHFMHRGIPVALVAGEQFSVWVMGNEHKTWSGSEEDPPPNSEAIEGGLIASANGFRDKFLGD